MRIRAFRHMHDLSMLHQQSERRGSLVSRVTSDVDQITQFLQWGGVILLVSLGQLVVTTVVMLVYSWQLTLVVLRRVRAGGARDPAVPAAARRGLRRRSGERIGRDARRGRARAWSARRGDPGVRGRRRAPPAGWTRAIEPATAAQQRAMRISVISISIGEFGGRPGAGRGGGGRGAARGRTAALTHRAADRVPVPGHAVRPAGADRHRGAQRGAERDRRLAPGAGRAGRRAGRGRPGAHGRDLPTGPAGRAVRRGRLRLPGRCRGACTTWTWTFRRRPGWRWSARPAAARPRSRSC